MASGSPTTRAGDGPPIVLLHGAASDARLFRPQLSALADEFTLIAWDEPGAGRSDEPPEHFGLADYADAAAGLIAAIGLDSVQIGGLSWGGVVAQEVYRRHPDRVRSLLLFDTYAGWKGSLSAEELREPLAPERSSRRAFHRNASRRRPRCRGCCPSPRLPRLVAELAEIVAETNPAALRRVAIAVSECDHRDLLPRIDVPTLLHLGRSRHPLAAQHRRAVSRRDPGCPPGHDRPAPATRATWSSRMRFNRALREFCREVAAASGA